jgi:hypothetical protein
MFCTYQKQQSDIKAGENRKTTLSGPKMYVELNSEQPQYNSLGFLETLRRIKEKL